MKIKNRQDFLVVLTIAVAGLYLGVLFIFTPLQSWWSDRQQQVVQLRTKVHDGNQLIRSAARLRSRWQDMQANALPADSSVAQQQFLRALNGWSGDSGAKITTITPQWKDDISTNYMTLDCRVEASGELGTLARFIYDIEKGPMAVRVDSADLSASDNEGQTMTLGVEISGLALLQNNQK